MAIRLAPRLALATAAALGLSLPSFGLPLGDSCHWTGGVASAAPSPTCASDLRECLRLSADMHQTTFGGRYVTAEDVARCMEAFDACRNGGLSRGRTPNPPESTPAEGGTTRGLPQRFTIRAGDWSSDCRRNGDAVSCTEAMDPLPAYASQWEATFTGTLSGWTLSGTETENSSLDPGSNTCGTRGESSGAVTYVFRPDGTVTVRKGVFQVHGTFWGSPYVTGGDCSKQPPNDYSLPETEWTATWSPAE